MTMIAPVVDQLVILEHASWETYERLLAERQGRGGARFTYDGGRLEIMVLSGRYEEPSRALAILIDVLAEELDLNIRRFGSMTIQRPDLQKGFEPDECFYIQNVQAIRGKPEVNVMVDPPPDLLIEIDVTNLSLDKFPIFAAVGVPEIWRYDERRVSFHQLVGGRYQNVAHSLAFPLLTSDDATRFLQDSLTLESTTWYKRVREWIRSQN